MLDEERAEIIRGLQGVGESLRILRAFVEFGAPCVVVLRQLCTIQAELQTLKAQMLNCQITASRHILQFDPSADIRLIEVHRLLELYKTLVQST